MSGPATTGALTSGHATYPPTTIIAGSSKVTIEGKGALSIAQHSHVPHANTLPPFDVHSGVVTVGSPKVFIEGSPAVRIGDPLSCGDTVASGAIKVVFG